MKRGLRGSVIASLPVSVKFPPKSDAVLTDRNEKMAISPVQEERLRAIVKGLEGLIEQAEAPRLLQEARSELDKLLNPPPNADPKDPYSVPFRHWFNVASGIRGTDEARTAAVLASRELQKLLQTPEGTRKAAEWGMKIAEETRTKLAEMLGCKPRNIFFANSATRALIPILLVLGRKREYQIIANPYDYPVLGTLIEQGELENHLTRQNFGLRSIDDGSNKALERLRKNFRVNRSRLDWSNPSDHTKCAGYNLCPWYDGWERWYQVGWHRNFHYSPSKHPARVFLLLENPKNPALYYINYVNRYFGFVESEHTLRINIQKIRELNKNSIVVLDASHPSGTLQTNLVDIGADIVITSSSKVLGAEPTSGICYVSDRILGMLEQGLPKTMWPSVAFQFSPKTALGTRTSEQAASANYWTSLPELYSLDLAIDEHKVGQQKRKLEELRGFLYWGLDFLENIGLVRLNDETLNLEIETFTMEVETRKPVINHPNFISFSGFIRTDWFKELTPRKRNNLHNRFHKYLRCWLSPFIITLFSSESVQLRLDSMSQEVRRKVGLPVADARISWSAEHNIDDAKKLMRKLVYALVKIRYPPHLREEPLDPDQIFTDMVNHYDEMTEKRP